MINKPQDFMKFIGMEPIDIQPSTWNRIASNIKKDWPWFFYWMAAMLIFDMIWG